MACVPSRFGRRGASAGRRSHAFSAPSVPRSDGRGGEGAAALGGRDGAAGVAGGGVEDPEITSKS
jgi:hypothetical protein